ncbi:hypothetical protein [uncultured Roseovarius sp.]|uniref:hypothetical protein n=1 Tax=uncultured Roseovarius sp. TaxID=293344 RepID=UPI002637CD04|nr:hypothetical protein [uncultured Roseovarius sp.]
MPLTILLPLVIIGIVGIAVLLHFLGLSKPARFDNEAAAKAAWLREFPEDVPTRITLCQNHSAALVDASQGRGIVWPMGADTTARYLTDARIERTGNGLCITLPDYTAPRIRLTLEAEEAAIWVNLMKEFA